ncbi:VIT1/CCC1 transporter family protein [uncultured Bilophila sp.]|uniref:VIT1/CCC1 transporter family protein n=1 Tax=uncultured Bilophila sp. TaxID=529385 RepID=UPI00280ABDD7|nr:VIT1/CCC1 transporter family protein [uncultured Bilophila sp.]
MKEETLAIVRRMQDNEATDQRVYAALAKQAGLQKNREILEKMSHDEATHCAVWERYTGVEAKADMFRVWLFVVLGKIFGLVFVINLMEGGEDDSAENYRKLIDELPEARGIMEDETRHEEQLAAMIHEEKLSYISSMVLGLNDALVELTGALAGFTLALNDNRMVGMAGFITGVAATLSMAASEYLSKKADTSEKHPLKAAVYTGVAYMITVAFLLLPYIVFDSPLVALGFCLFDAALIILGFTYFVSVVRKESFVRGFTEMIAISFSVAGISFLIGWAARSWLNIDM